MTKLTPILKLGRVAAWLEFKPQDLWVGTFYRRTALVDGDEKPFVTELWICFLPCLPIHVQYFHPVTIEF